MSSSTAKEIIGLACVNVGTGQGARVTLVDRRGQIVYDTFVQPTSPVESYRTITTGLDASYFTNAIPFDKVQLDVARWIQNKVIVGHSLWLDLQVLGLSHPAVDTRDVALFLPFRVALRRPNDTIGLPTLVWHLMRRKIQETYVDSSENSRACVDLYRSHNREWEEQVTQGQWPCALPPVAYNRCYV